MANLKGAHPGIENTARQTLDHPMTFKILGEGLRLFEGWGLRDLANLRKRYRDNLKSCFESFLKLKNRNSKSGLLVLLILSIPAQLFRNISMNRAKRLH